MADSSSDHPIPKGIPDATELAAQNFLYAGLKRMATASGANRFWIQLEPGTDFAFLIVGATGVLGVREHEEDEVKLEPFHEISAAYRVDSTFLRNLARSIDGLLPQQGL